jgi:hypothetical protein
MSRPTEALNEIPVAKEFLHEKSLDFQLAQELNDMSIEEREQVYEQLHGVEKIIEESPVFVAERLEALNVALSRISTKPAYEQAERISREYVQDRKFRLSFLRAEYFDPKKAAIRMIKFMEAKLKYYGPEALARPVNLTDLDEDDMETLKTGHLQILPARDMAGRAVFYDFNTMFPRCYISSRNMVSS